MVLALKAVTLAMVRTAPEPEAVGEPAAAVAPTSQPATAVTVQPVPPLVTEPDEPVQLELSAPLKSTVKPVAPALAVVLNTTLRSDVAPAFMRVSLMYVLVNVAAEVILLRKAKLAHTSRNAANSNCTLVNFLLIFFNFFL